MPVLVIRHALSEANNRDNIGTPAFANPAAPLMDTGKQQAIQLGSELMDRYGIDFSEPIAVSEFRRTSETATLAGFYALNSYALLNEVAHGLDLAELRQSLDDGQLPPAALSQAETILAHPPEERIWVTHALVIAGLCAVMGLHQDKRLIPRFCEVRSLPSFLS
jgi:hypothetical protein